ncbi:MAG: PHP domain-containing protein [Microbacteriaceae bacterium]|nr:PHP domain-containing protein [Cryobacterium sp.]MCC6375852.1 PHP domain-containing protein [Microbacteriaceae bacterium]
MPELIDLHTHSRVSDGTETPTEVIQAAIKSGLGTIALTDHDTTDGWAEAFEAAEGTGVQVIPGMEFSTRWEGKSIHLLAYLIDPENLDLRAETLRIREERLRRAETIVDKLANDFEISWRDVLDHAGEGATIGRPHIADVLIAKGIVEDRGQAFHEILRPGGHYYVPHYAPDPLRAIQLVVAAGGVPVLAHPATRGVGQVISKQNLAHLVDAGLFGLELKHRENQADAVAVLEDYAKYFGLVSTGSSDYHGAGKPNRLGENSTDSKVLERIIAAATGSSPFQG